MQPNTQLLRSVWEDANYLLSKADTALQTPSFDELVSSIFCAGPFYYYIIDFYDMSISHMSPSVRDIHGFNPETTTFEDILSQIHPDDMPYVSQAEATILHYIYKNIGLNKLTRYKMSYCFRFRTKDGSYKLFHHQAIALTTDANNGLGKSLNVHVDISHLCKENNHRPSLIGLFGEPSYLDLDLVHSIPSKKSKSLFSQREKQIIQLLAQGHTNPEIAEKLFISLHTAKNHRKNILHKAECKTVGQLVAKCVAEGWI